MADHKVRLFSEDAVMTTKDTTGYEAYRALFEIGIALNKDLLGFALFILFVFGSARARK